VLAQRQVGSGRQVRRQESAGKEEGSSEKEGSREEEGCRKEKAGSEKSCQQEIVTRGGQDVANGQGKSGQRLARAPLVCTGDAHPVAGVPATGWQGWRAVGIARCGGVPPVQRAGGAGTSCSPRPWRQGGGVAAQPWCDQRCLRAPGCSFAGNPAG